MTTGLERPPLSAEEAGVLALVDEELVVSMTRRLVRATGENPPGQEAQTAAVLVALAEELGLAHSLTEVAPGRPNVTVTLPGAEGPGLLMLGHTDVVPVGDGWSVEPFGAEVRDGRVYGRGTADMKGGLAATLAAMSAIGRAGVALAGPLRLAALVDEEQLGIGVRRWVAEPPPDVTGCIVVEPTDLQTVTAARGDCYLVVTVHGRAAHAGQPDDGCNAIAGAAVVVAELERWHAELAARAHPLVGAPTFSVGVVRGGVGPSVVPAECRLEVDRRLLPGERAPDVLAAVRDRLEGLGLDERGLTWSVDAPMDMPGFETPATDPFVATVDRALAAGGGPGRPLGGWTAACDGGFVAAEWGVPVVVLGAGSVTEQAHRADESVAVDDLVVAARAYTLAALRLLR